MRSGASQAQVVQPSTVCGGAAGMPFATATSPSGTLMRKE
jgi:hypothetical protein